MDGEAAHHLGRVLRAQAGQVYELSDGSRVRLGRIENVTRDEVEFALLEEIPSYQPAVHTTLLLAIVKFDAFEWALEKATELGVASDRAGCGGAEREGVDRGRGETRRTMAEDFGRRVGAVATSAGAGVARGDAICGCFPRGAMPI